METALTYTLQRVSWQFFGSPTFKSAKLPERVRLTMFFALVRCLCRWHKVPFRKCVWALRQEPGEISGRLHFHFLIAGFRVALQFDNLLVLRWRQVTHTGLNMGASRIHAFFWRNKFCSPLFPHNRDLD